MSWLGTDVMAVACILGGAATGGAVTMALTGGDHDPSPACAVESFSVPSSVVLTTDGVARSFVVAPRIRTRTSAGCAEVVGENIHIHMSRAQRNMQRAQERMERAKERMERAHRRTERMRVRVHPRHRSDVEGQFEAQVLELEALEEAMKQLELSLESAVTADVSVELEDLQQKIQEEVRKGLEKRSRGGS